MLRATGVDLDRRLTNSTPSADRIASLPATAEQSARLDVQVNAPGKAISPMLYGIFFEEINRSGDGGIYAEMLQNRSFEDADKPNAWTSLTGEMSLDKTTPLNADNPTALRLNGSVANEVRHLSRVPVLLVRGDRETGAPRVLRVT